MNRLALGVMLAVVFAFCGGVAAQDCPPGGESTFQTWNGQPLEMITAGISTSVEFSEVSDTRIAGMVRRTGGGEGCVTIHWMNKKMTVVLHLSAEVPGARFEIATTPVVTKTLSQVKRLYR